MSEMRTRARDALSGPPAYVPTSGLDGLHANRDRAAKDIARALQPVIPAGFRAKVTITVENGVVEASSIAIELRSPQGKS
jgi:hypothetical protein